VAHRIVLDVLELEATLGHSISREEYEAKGKYGGLITRYFGGWEGVLRAIARRQADIEDTTREPKILLFDLETAPMKLLGFGLYDQNFSIDQIDEDWFLLSFAAKWLGKPAIYYADQKDSEVLSDDKRLLKMLWHLFDEADIVLTQNGKSFDEKVANARFVIQGFPPTKPYQHIDTKQLAKRRFRFTSNKLEYMAKALGVDCLKGDHKKFPGFKLWKECLARNPEVWEEMRTYNIADVLALEGVYLKLRPWGTGVNLNLFYSDAKYHCESCGSLNIKFDRTQAKNSGVYLQFQCQDCGRWGAKKGSGNNQLSDAKRASLRGPE
jgi:DNA polymerase elongation subunit (family B)